MFSMKKLHELELGKGPRSMPLGAESEVFVDSLRHFLIGRQAHSCHCGQ
jgi:hypothetical protein